MTCITLSGAADTRTTRPSSLFRHSPPRRTAPRYYVLVSMTLNVDRTPVPGDGKPPLRPLPR
ncbi:MAG: hypothetical protein HY848_22575 [Betaproteobacteria bacterium]|nr:hypothetical protein [Betaproteobacteria bacterium]